LEDEEPGLPTTKILTTFSEVALLVPSLHHGLLLPGDIRRKKGDNFIVVLDRESDQGLEVVLKNGLD